MAAPTLAGVGTAQDGTSGFSLAYPASVSANDIAVIFCETANNDVTTPAGWTQLASSPQSTSGAAGGTSATRLTIFWQRCAGTEGGGTVSLTGSFDHLLAQMLTYSGCATSGDPVNASAGDNTATTSSTAVTVPGLTTTVADCRVVVACSRMGDLAGSDRFSGWTNADLTGLAEDTEAGSAAGNGGGFAVASGAKATAGAVGATTATLADSSRQARISFALAPAGGGGSTLDGASILSGSGTATAVGKTTAKGIATVSGSGTATASASVRRGGAASLTGSGTLSSAASRSIPAAVSLSGSGTLTAIAARRVSGASALSGTSALAIVASTILKGTTTLSGDGTLTAAGTVSSGLSGASSLSGSGTLTAAAHVVNSGGAALAASGTLATSASVARGGAVILTGTGGLAALAYLEASAASALSGDGSLVAVGTLHPVFTDYTFTGTSWAPSESSPTWTPTNDDDTWVPENRSATWTPQ